MDILDRPAGLVEAGRVRLGGTDLLSLGTKARRALNGARMAIIFQDARSDLNPASSIGWQIAKALRIHGSRIDPRFRTIELLRRVGIPDPETQKNGILTTSPSFSVNGR